MLTMTFHRARLADPHEWTPVPWAARARYMLGVPMQVGPTQAAMLCNLHAYGYAVDDLEAGVDAIVFDDLSTLDPRAAVPLLRCVPMPHPVHGKPMVLVKFPVFGGFVPLGAKLADGRPHPHAGSGFGLATALGYPADHSSSWPAGDADIFHRTELQQYRFDGARFEVVSSKLLENEHLLPGMHMDGLPLCHAMSAGEDLLFPMVAMRPGARASGAVMTRWRCGAEGWRPIECTEVTGEDASTEPSAIRDSDGSILLTVRGGDHRAVRHGKISADAVRAGWHQVWRSRDDGKSWDLLIARPGMCHPCPISISKTASGRVFLAGTPVQPPVPGPDGNPLQPGAVRSPLCFWELSADRRSVSEPTVALDCDAKFGPAPRRGNWLADHPCGAVLTLRDGRQHSVMSFRVAALDETSAGKDSTEFSGCWCEEVVDVDEPRGKQETRMEVLMEERGRDAGLWLIIGGSGMLGRAFRQLLTARQIRFDAPSHAELDLTRADAVKSAVGSRYRAVINCAAWTDVDGAESKQAEADAVNGAAVANLIRACVQGGSTLVHFSTDYVFQGSTTPLKVDAVRQPPNAYGRSKLLGEQAIEAADPESRHHLLLRTSWLYAAWGKNFVRTIAKASRERPALRVVNDQRGRPTSCNALAQASLALLLARANERTDDAIAPVHRGTFHVTDGGECTWFDFATEIAAFANPACKVEPCSSDEYKRAAVRPAYSVMDLSRTESIIGPMPHWKSTLAGVLRALE